jgi:hypothetical protein
MDGLQLSRPFSRMGARVGSALHPDPGRIRIDVKRDRYGEYFEVLAGNSVRVIVPDVQPDMRHLLLVAHRAGDVDKQKYLCGHDERHWFAAAVPEVRGVSSVRTAIEALKPADVRFEILRAKVPPRQFASRKTAAYRRQGEWFFLPRPEVRVTESLVRRNEPMRRGGGKPHIAQFAYRTGGETVYFRDNGRVVLGVQEYAELLRSNPAARQHRWILGRRNMDLFVKGRISHPDHATLVLDCWHLVRMNTENQAASMQHLAFID